MVERKVKVYLDPTPTGYKSQANYAAGDKVPVVIDGVKVDEIPVDELLP